LSRARASIRTNVHCPELNGGKNARILRISILSLRITFRPWIIADFYAKRKSFTGIVR